MSWKHPIFWTLLALATISAQAQWEIEESHTTASLRGVANPGGGVAWASGSNGTVVRTEDGGYLWQTCAIPPGAEKLDFRGIQAFDENTAIIMSSGTGDLSRIYKTTDGCQTWTLLFTNPDKEGFFDAISINTPSKDALGKPMDHSHAWGYVLGDPVDGVFPLFETTDGGTTWSRVVAQPRDPQGGGCKIDAFKAKGAEAAFAASNESLISLSGAYLLFVTGGTSSRMGYTRSVLGRWSAMPRIRPFQCFALAQGTASSGAFAIAVRPQHPDKSNYPYAVVVVGGDYKLPDATAHNAAYGSHIGTWMQALKESTTPPHGFRSAVAYDAEAKTWITIGPNGTDISTDDGKNWKPLLPTAQDTPDADKNWNALALPFVVGPKGRIGKLRTNALDLTTRKP